MLSNGTHVLSSSWDAALSRALHHFLGKFAALESVHAAVQVVLSLERPGTMMLFALVATIAWKAFHLFPMCPTLMHCIRSFSCAYEGFHLPHQALPLRLHCGRSRHRIMGLVCGSGYRIALAK